jgi:hypothetical protein
MAAKAHEIMFEYLAHIQKDDGHTLELAGTRDARTINDVYQWLCEMAKELGGFLVSQRIHVGESTNQQARDVAKKRPVVVEAHVPQVPAAFSDRTAFGVYTTPYKAASLCTYKVTKEE